MAVNINLYPPIVDTYIPAFIADEGVCRVYFSLSKFNVEEDIANVQITIRNQFTNLSVLDSSKYPSAIMIKKLQQDDTITTDAKYYIEINKEDMQGGKFDINQYYKVQLRFTPKNDKVPSPPADNKLDGWLAAYIEYFSEWSTVCLIRGISEPSLDISGYILEDGVISWSNVNPTIYGELTFADDNETEQLKSYSVKLYNKNQEVLTDSGILFTTSDNNKNSFIYTFKYNFMPGDYSFEIAYQTMNNYIDTYALSFSVQDTLQENQDLSFAAVADEENGRIIITIKNPTNISYTGDLTIRRASSVTNFTYWENIKDYSFTTQTGIKETYSDNTIESGVWYKYALIDTLNNTIKEIKKPVMTIFDDMFLTTKDRQLKLKFNPTVSSFKRMVQESRTDTLGSQYPFIRRNGYANYAQFPIGGLISFQMDEAELFTSLEELFGEHLKLYSSYNEEHRFSTENDWMYEKLFKDKVSEFLYDGQPKLFRSATEGNFIIKLMDVSLSPNATLGRRIVSFTATAYEMADCTVDNFKKYGILEGADE